MKLTTNKFDLKQKLNKRETIIFLGTILVAILGFYKSYVVPGIKEISDAKQKIELLKEDRSHLTAQINAQKEMKITSQVAKQWTGTVETVNRSANALAKPLHLAGIKIKEIRLSETQNTPKYLTLTISGTFSAIGQYIEYLENLPAPLVIDSISIAHDGSTLSNLVSKLQGGFYVSNTPSH